MNDELRRNGRRWEIALLMLLFFVHGGWPVPDTNESYYVGKAIHFYHPDEIVGDTFLDSKDAHWLFYATFGSLSLLLPPTVMAWTGRLFAWLFLAFAWRRLSCILIPVRYFSILTAAGMLYYLDAFSMSGEWIVGGVEGKSFAFPLMFLGLAAMLQGRWNHVWLYFGAASAFHVLVGGWAVVIALPVLIIEKLILVIKTKKLPTPSAFLTGILFLFLGGLLSLPGLIPALQLDWNTATEITRQAHYIYVYERLPHHLHPDGFPWTFKFRFAALTLLWAALSAVVLSRKKDSHVSFLISHFSFWRLTGFVFGSLLLAGIGLASAWILRDDPKSAAGFLRYYWFRTCDFAVPMGVSFAASMLFVYALEHGKIRFDELKRLPDFNALVKNLCRAFFLYGGFGVTVFLILHGLIFGLIFPASSMISHGVDGAGTILPTEPNIAWALTLLVGIGMLSICDNIREHAVWKGWVLLLGTIVVLAPLGFCLKMAEQRVRPGYSRSDPTSVRHAYLWTDACRWINDPANGIPKNAKFLTPRESTNFKWNTHRPEVVTWKDIPQDAQGIVQWYDTIERIYPKIERPPHRNYALQQLYGHIPPSRLEKLQQKYEFDYILCGKYPALKLPVVYANAGYVIYEAKPAPVSGGP